MADPATVDWASIIASGITALTTLAAGWGLYLQAKGTAQKVDATAQKVDDNTELTQRAKDAAEQVQIATVERLEFDRLRRVEAAVLTLEECEGCREKILALTERRRLRPHTSEEHPNL